MNRRRSGTLLALTSATGFGVMPVLTKVVYDDGPRVAGVLSVRFTLAAVVLLGLARLRGERRPGRRQALVLLALGGGGYGLQSLCYFSALTRISAGLTALLLYLYPALVVVLSAGLTRSWPSRRSSVCVAVATAGTALTIGPVGGGQLTGVLLGAAAALVYATYILASSRHISGVGPLTSAGLVMSGAALVYDVGAVATRAVLPSHAGAWLALGGVALLGSVVAVSTFFAAVERLGPADTSVLSTLEPVVSVGVAAVALGESLSIFQLGGGALVLAAVAVLARSPAPVPLDAG